MTLEVITAILVGLAVLAVVLQPLLRSAPRPESAPVDLLDPEETPRGIALAALREIEFDRATGKLSDEDYAALKSRYTEQALALIRADDNREAAAGESAQADPIEAMIAARVRTLREGEQVCPRCGPRPEADAVFCSNCGDRLGEAGSCAACHTPLLPGSRFCESCGAQVAA